MASQVMLRQRDATGSQHIVGQSWAVIGVADGVAIRFDRDPGTAFVQEQVNSIGNQFIYDMDDAAFRGATEVHRGPSTNRRPDVDFRMAIWHKIILPKRPGGVWILRYAKNTTREPHRDVGGFSDAMFRVVALFGK